jgi:hypothetical protein
MNELKTYPFSIVKFKEAGLFFYASLIIINV